MPDTLERLHALVQEGLGTPPPAETLRRPVRRSTRLRRAPALALMAASIIAVVAIAIAYGGAPNSKGPGPKPSAHTPSTLKYTVDTAATAAGWTAVDWSDAQISVPSHWTVSGDSCGIGPRQLAVDPPPSSAGCNTVRNDPPWAVLRALPHSYPKNHPATVNGVQVYRSSSSIDRSGPVQEYAPSLGVELEVASANAGQARSIGGRILGTLTHSPRQVVLEPGPRPGAPSNWRRVGVEGLTFRVPPTDGSPRRLSVYPTALRACTPAQSMADSVVLDTDRRFGVYHCLPEFGWDAKRMFSAGSGVEVDARPQAVASDSYPVQLTGLSKHCEAINGLRVCPYAEPATDILAFLVSGRGLAHPLLLEIGLGGNGMTARTILYSLRAA